MNLSEMKLNNKIKLLLIGDSGAGKTVFSTSPEGKIFVFDFDNKLSSAAAYWSVKNPAKLKDIEYEQFSLDKGTEPYIKFRQKLQGLTDVAAKGDFPYQTVVVDSLTLYAEAMMAYFMAKNSSIKRAFEGIPAMQDYLVAGSKFRDDMNRLLALPCNVICIAHSTSSMDESTGETKNGILLSGKTADHLPRIFTEVAWAYTKVTQPKAPGEASKIEYLANTRKFQRFTCRTQIPGIPDTIPLDFGVYKAYADKLGENNK